MTYTPGDGVGFVEKEARGGPGASGGEGGGGLGEGGDRRGCGGESTGGGGELLPVCEDSFSAYQFWQFIILTDFVFTYPQSHNITLLQVVLNPEKVKELKIFISFLSPSRCKDSFLFQL